MSYFLCKVKVKKTGREMTFGAEYPGEDRTVDEMKAFAEKHWKHMDWISGEAVDTRPPQTGPLPAEAITHGIKAEMLATARAAAAGNANAGEGAGGDPQPGASDVKTAPGPGVAKK